jgi:hypothetical protein
MTRPRGELKLYPSDPRSTLSELKQEVRRAGEELRWLLDRGYPQESALTFVCNHYKLSLKERNILARTVFSEREAAELKRRKADLREVLGKRVGIDGYNVLITVETIVNGRPVFLCDDGWVRDVSAVFGKHRITPQTSRALDELLSLLDSVRPAWVEFLYEKQVSWSGRLAELTRKKIEEKELDGTAKTVAGVDHELKRRFDLIATSDRAVILKHRKVLDLPSLVAGKLGTPLLRL